ncbi:MAG: hypothetical protein ACREPV_04865 [Lysobacter sp.]
MTDFRKYVCRIVETFPAFFIVSFFFCVLVEYGPDIARRDAADAILEPLGAAAVILLFIAGTALTGLTLLIFGSVTEESAANKRSLIRVLVERPASFVVDLTAPMFSVVFAVIVACFLFGYRDKVAGLALVLGYLFIFALLNMGLVALTRSSFLERIDTAVAGGRAVGGFLLISSVVLFYWVLPLGGH